jgi:hypothetical protein
MAHTRTLVMATRGRHQAQAPRLLCRDELVTTLLEALCGCASPGALRSERLAFRPMKCWHCGEDVPEDVEKRTTGGEGVGRYAFATAFELGTFEHAFCPACGAGLRRQVGQESDKWDPAAEDVDESRS